MGALLTIGDFSRMTYLSVKALRHYHDVGVLEPADIDPATGYRRYTTEQVPIAQVVRRFRDLGMPLNEIKRVLSASDVEARNDAIVRHLRRMERQLADVQSTVSALRRLLEPAGGALPVEYRTVPATRVLAIDDRIAMSEVYGWWSESFERLASALTAADAQQAGIQRAGPDGALYYEDYFTSEKGRVVAFVPITGPAVNAVLSGAGGLRVAELPAAEFAVATHAGPFDTLDQTYGALGTYVAERELGVEGPIRETYLVTGADTADPAQHRTEVCWPIFQTASPCPDRGR